MSKENNSDQLFLSDDGVLRVEKQLASILKSSHFKSAKRMQQFLNYVVRKTLEGDARTVKQYTIAIEALDFPDDFDADTNPAVRILAGRVRERLDNYYKKEGFDDSLIIQISKGSYAPQFIERKDEPSSKVVSINGSSDDKKAKINWRYLGMGAFALVAFAILFTVFNQQKIKSNNAANETAAYNIPLVDVMPFDNLSNESKGEMLSKGIRNQFITDLSQFDMIRVRDISDIEGQQESKNIINARFRIKGALLSIDNELQVTIFLQEVRSSEILWTKKVTVPATDDGFNKLMFEGVKGVMTKVAGPTGVMHLDAMQHLRDRLSVDKNGVTTSYECVLLFYDYDQTKDKDTEKEARKCLAEHTENNVQNSNLWAVHGLMLILDWTKRKDKSDNTLNDKALISIKKAIRIDPNNAIAHKYYGDYYMVQGRNDEAISHYQMASELNPSKPDIRVSIGWHKVNLGDWDDGIKEVREGVAMSYRPPAYFHIPLAVDAFRRNDFEESLKEAEIIFDSGDKRGIALSLAAAVKLDRPDLVKRYTKAYSDYRKDDLVEPLREVSSVLKTPKILEQYSNTLKPILEKLGSQ